MKLKLLLILSVVCMLAALTVFLVVPVVAGTHGATIDKWNVPDQNVVEGQTIKAHIMVTNTDPSLCTLRIDVIEDTINHIVGGDEPSGNLLSSPVLLIPGASKEVTFDYIVRVGDLGPANPYDPKMVPDEAYVKGWDPVLQQYFKLYYPGMVTPVPEISAGVLFGAGMLGLGGFVVLKRRQSAAKI
jgi:hypothetical protein